MKELTLTQRRIVLASCFGTFLEWYDFLTFATLATYFSVLFFPPDNPTAALLMSLGTFGIAAPAHADTSWYCPTCFAAPTPHH